MSDKQMNTLHGCPNDSTDIDLLEDTDESAITPEMISYYCDDYWYLEIQDRSSDGWNNDTEYMVIDSWSRDQ